MKVNVKKRPVEYAYSLENLSAMDLDVLVLALSRLGNAAHNTLGELDATQITRRARELSKAIGEEGE
jgi:hypothetical protein